MRKVKSILYLLLREFRIALGSVPNGPILLNGPQNRNDRDSRPCEAGLAFHNARIDRHRGAGIESGFNRLANRNLVHIRRTP